MLSVACSQIMPPAGMLRNVSYTKAPSPTYNAHEIPVYIDKGFKAEDQLMLEDAINDWNYALNGTMKLVVKSTTFNMDMNIITEVFHGSGGFLILSVNSKDPAIPPAANPNMIDLAWTDLSNHHVIYVVRDRVALTSDITPIMLHEIGHVLGAQHIPGYGLMNPTFDAQEYKCVDSNAADQIAEYNNIDRQFLNFCYDAQEKVK